MSKAALARSLGIARASLYYVSRMEKKDWATKVRMEGVLREDPSTAPDGFIKPCR